MDNLQFNWERPASLAAFGAALRHRREALALTLDALAAATSISKPYLSNIETARAPGPPLEAKLRALALALNLPEHRLLAGADRLRTPDSIRKTLTAMSDPTAHQTTKPSPPDAALNTASESAQDNNDPPRRPDGTIDLDRLVQTTGTSPFAFPKINSAAAAASAPPAASPVRPSPRPFGHAEGGIPVQPIPLINRVAAGNAAEFGDLSYPAGVADQYVAAPDLPDAPVATAFALKVLGDSMLPDYHAGDVVIVGPADPKDGDDCVVRLGELDNFATTFKRVHFEKNADGETTAVRLVALNPSYGQKIVTPDQITGIYPLIYRLVPPRKSQAPTQDPSTHQSLTTTRNSIEHD